MSKRPIPSADDDQHQRKRQHRQSLSTSTALPMAIPPPNTVTPWSSSEISSQLPPLPKILDPEVETAVFTHRGVDMTCNYERYEWVGDAYLEMVATILIFQTFNLTSAGRSSQLREQLVRNTTLAEYFRLYKMEKRARLPSLTDLSRSEPKSKDSITKIYGDIFEAYVAGVIISDPVNGLANVASWLKALWGRTIKDQIQKEEKLRALKMSGKTGNDEAGSSGGNKNVLPKERLAQILMVKGIRLRYEDMPNKDKKDRNLGLPLFTMGVYLDGWGETNKLLGIGSALGKKEAGQKAATMALENKKLMKLYRDQKTKFQEAQQKTREEAEAEAGAN
ncbi:abhydrolase domain-containing protein [Thelonectria olida]|uniref:Abhydrolase domain-containing protein n=1 Tax=Thelonectria olida TaxID=1576542 RepID=A0A9P8W584_9HYPO|nr:abhydrolase domain-containing protein [Thelonectria olida]